MGRCLVAYAYLKVEVRGRVGWVVLHRPKALNALSSAMMAELGGAVRGFEKDDGIGAVVITGGEEVFAAGADIAEMQGKGYVEAYCEDFISADWEAVEQCRKPVIAAVAGYALGGGCELAMMCDFIIAGEGAQFGQPEIKLGVIPGAGGTQRLTRAVGKAKAMEMCLSGRMMGAEEAERAGLVARVVKEEVLMEEALKCAEKIAGMSLPAVMMCKEAVARAEEVGLREGMRFERGLFYALFGTKDKEEGMKAFLEKRKAEWGHR